MTITASQLARLALVGLQGCQQGVGLMREGERRRLWIPAPLVRGGVLQSAVQDLTMDMELVSIHRGMAPPSTLELTPPADAIRTPSGLAYRILEPGGGRRRPSPSDHVRIDYAAWTADGMMFRTTYAQRASTVPVSGLIPGWSEGVQRMVEGERARLWIPEHLGYRRQDGQPKGTIVLDLHLLAIIAPRAARPGP